MIVFLDFDGVLHPIPNKGSSDFSLLSLFESWLRIHGEVHIVISSSWRENMSFDELKAIFSSDIQNRILDKCPCIEDIGQVQHYRYIEILQWIKLNAYSGKWIAIDDMASAFPEGFKQLVVCDSAVGIDENILAELSCKVINNDWL